MNARSSRSLAVLSLSVLLTACGAASVAPAPDAAAPDAQAAPADAVVATPDRPAPIVDVPAVSPDRPAVAVDAPSAPDVPAAPDTPAVADSPTASPCSEARPIAAGARVTLAAIERVDGAFVVAWVPVAADSVVAQVFDDSLTPMSRLLTLSSGRPAGDSLSLSFTGDAGVVASGSSLYVLRLATRRSLELVNTLDLSPRVARFALAVSATDFRVVTSDTALAFSNGARITTGTANDPATDPIGPAASVHIDNLAGGYSVFEDAGGRFRMRRFITGHGSTLQVGDESGDGASASPVVDASGALYRLVYEGAREVDVALESRDPETFAVRARPAVVHPRAAWISTDGAIAALGADLLLTWASHPESGGYNSALRARWGLDGEPVELHRAEGDRVVHVFGAAVDEGAARAWVLFGERDPMGGQRLLGRCAAR